MAIEESCTWKSITLADAGTYDFKPENSNQTDALEAILQNIFWTNAKAVEIYRVDYNGGANTATLFMSISAAQATISASIEHVGWNQVKNQQWHRIKNVSGGNINVYGDGRRTS